MFIHRMKIPAGLSQPFSLACVKRKLEYLTSARDELVLELQNIRALQRHTFAPVKYVSDRKMVLLDTLKRLDRKIEEYQTYSCTLLPPIPEDG